MLRAWHSKFRRSNGSPQPRPWENTRPKNGRKIYLEIPRTSSGEERRQDRGVGFRFSGLRRSHPKKVIVHFHRISILDRFRRELFKRVFLSPTNFWPPSIGGNQIRAWRTFFTTRFTMGAPEKKMIRKTNRKGAGSDSH